VKKLASISKGGVPEITVAELHQMMTQSDWQKRAVQLIDVRMPEEFTGNLGHIEGSKLVTLGPDLQEDLDQGDRRRSIVFICRSGSRSAHATSYAIDIGYENVANLQGGMIAWNEAGLSRS
jgi:rhodanese-related sulfurtransferase